MFFPKLCRLCNDKLIVVIDRKQYRLYCLCHDMEIWICENWIMEKVNINSWCVFNTYSRNVDPPYDESYESEFYNIKTFKQHRINHCTYDFDKNKSIIKILTLLNE